MSSGAAKLYAATSATGVLAVSIQRAEGEYPATAYQKRRLPGDQPSGADMANIADVDTLDIGDYFWRWRVREPLRKPDPAIFLPCGRRCWAAPTGGLVVEEQYPRHGARAPVGSVAVGKVGRP